VFISQPGSKLERDQQEWEAKHGEQSGSVGVMVQTPLFVREEHRVEIEYQAGQRQQERSHDEVVVVLSWLGLAQFGSA
jgi:hypothetical protein